MTIQTSSALAKNNVPTPSDDIEIEPDLDDDDNYSDDYEVE